MVFLWLCISFYCLLFLILLQQRINFCFFFFSLVNAAANQHCLHTFVRHRCHFHLGHHLWYVLMNGHVQHFCILNIINMRRNVSLFYEKKRKRRNYEKIPHSFTPTDANEDTVWPFSGILQLKNGNTKLHHETNIFSF